MSANSSFSKASALVRSSPDYLDLSIAHYSGAASLLHQYGFLELNPATGALEWSHPTLPPQAACRILLGRILDDLRPYWLNSLDDLWVLEDDLPLDVALAADSLLLTNTEATGVAVQIRGKIDLERRHEIGGAGELALVQLLNTQWANSASHVASVDDGLGYDVLFRLDRVDFHLEVKTTTSAQGLRIFLSRNESEVALRDSAWILVLVVMDRRLTTVRQLFTIDPQVLQRLPLDTTPKARWQSVRLDLLPTDLIGGLRLPGRSGQLLDALP